MSENDRQSDRTAQSSDGMDRFERQQEQTFVERHGHVNEVTVGTVLEYDDWQWALVTEFAVDRDEPKLGFIMLDEVGDHIVQQLETATGCKQHYEVVEHLCGGDHEFWAPVEYVLKDDIWSVLGPVHPEFRDGEGDEKELVADGGTETSDTDRDECTNMNCHGEAEYAYWMPDLGQFSRVRNPEHDMLGDGDLAPYVCKSCRDHMAGSSHWDGERFFRPEEKLVTDGGVRERSHLVADCPECDGTLVEEHRTWPDDRVHVGLICHDCDTSARVEWPQGETPQEEDVYEGAAPNLRTRPVRWIDCPDCRGAGTVEKVGIQSGRTGCPRCYREGVVPRIVESDGGECTVSPATEQEGEQ